MRWNPLFYFVKVILDVEIQIVNGLQAYNLLAIAQLCLAIVVKFLVEKKSGSNLGVVHKLRLQDEWGR